MTPPPDSRRSTGAAGVTLDDVVISYGNDVAVAGANIVVEPGSFFTLLGPSGCGKTTLLRTIAGFIRQTSGTVRIGSEVIDDLPAHRRDTGMVFQNYAIFPHLTVAENIAYGLKARNVRGQEANKRIAESLEMVDLTGYEKRLPKQLSGGQQQRVVIARAIAIRPRVLLMDEPLANLDAKLRVRLRNDLKELQRELGITTIYVTHDQEEALSLSDRMAVMSRGHVEQIGRPEDVYQRPDTLNVASFIGEGNFTKAQLATDGRMRYLSYPGSQRLEVAPGISVPDGEVWAGFRPQDVSLTVGRGAGGAGATGLRGRVVFTEFMGPAVQVRVSLGPESTVVCQMWARDLAAMPEIGDGAELTICPDDVMIFPVNAEVETPE